MLGGYPVVFGMFVVFFAVGGFLVLPVQESRRRVLAGTVEQVEPDRRNVT
jgi:hypothetical protein